MGKLKGTKRKRHPRRRPQSSSYWFIGITERPARLDPARPGPARDRVLRETSGGWRKRASVPLGVPRTGVRGPSQAIGYSWSPARNWERHNESVTGDSRAIDCLAVTSTNTLVYPLSPFLDLPARATDRCGIEKCHRRIVYTLFQREKRIWHIDMTADRRFVKPMETDPEILVVSLICSSKSDSKKKMYLIYSDRIQSSC